MQSCVLRLSCVFDDAMVIIPWYRVSCRWPMSALTLLTVQDILPSEVSNSIGNSVFSGYIAKWSQQQYWQQRISRIYYQVKSATVLATTFLRLISNFQSFNHTKQKPKGRKKTGLRSQIWKRISNDWEGRGTRLPYFTWMSKPAVVPSLNSSN